MPTTGSRFQVADIAALVAGVVSFGFAIYGVPLRADDATLDSPIGALWLIYALGGGLAVLAVFLAQRNRGPARALLALAALVELAGLFLGWEIGWATRLTTLFLALIMAGAATSIGPVPVDRRPE